MKGEECGCQWIFWCE